MWSQVSFIHSYNLSTPRSKDNCIVQYTILTVLKKILMLVLGFEFLLEKEWDMVQSDIIHTLIYTNENHQSSLSARTGGLEGFKVKNFKFSRDMCILENRVNWFDITFYIMNSHQNTLLTCTGTIHQQYWWILVPISLRSIAGTWNDSFGWNRFITLLGITH